MLTTLDLQFVSPELLKAENLELAVPGTCHVCPNENLTDLVSGTYRSGKPVIRITRFFPKLSVLASKQRPRRLSIMGSNGVEYQFLLKGQYRSSISYVLTCVAGHEDLRQDERVMQLFGLVNALLAVDKDSFMRDLHIQRYAVIPLAANVGLLRWVGNSDTLHVLIRDYRDSKKILLNIEYRLMLQASIAYLVE
jgi:serine/threonine-protein kinase mTOR